MKSQAILQCEDEFAAFIGIDWADTKHDICLQAADGVQREFAVLPHRPADIDDWAHTLRKRFHGKPVAICIETSRGALVYALQKHDFLVLYPINPATLAKFRHAFKPSRAKADPTDAQLALEILMNHRDKLKPLRPQSPAIRALTLLLEERRQIVDEQRRIINRMISNLKQYYPLAHEWFDRKATPLFCEFIARWPTLKQLRQARRKTLETFFAEHNCHHHRLVEERLASIKNAVPLTEDPAIVRPKQLLVEGLAEQLRITLKTIARFDDEIAALAPTLPDYNLFRSLPGAAQTLAPRLMVAFGEQRERYASAAEIQMYAGIAPVTERSGKQHWVHWRMQCPTFLRQTFVEWAALTIPRSYWANAYYRQQRARGAAHQAALRALAFKWVRILYRCWLTRTPYDESTYLAALKRRGSPLLLPPIPQDSVQPA
jgi:transposase